LLARLLSPKPGSHIAKPQAKEQDLPAFAYLAFHHPKPVSQACLPSKAPRKKSKTKQGEQDWQGLGWVRSRQKNTQVKKPKAPRKEKGY